jgi:hypothetical protein
MTLSKPRSRNGFRSRMSPTTRARKILSYIMTSARTSLETGKIEDWLPFISYYKDFMVECIKSIILLPRLPIPIGRIKGESLKIIKNANIMHIV